MTTTEAQLSFREATQADIPELVTLIQSAYRGESSRAGWTTEADLLDGQRASAQTVSDYLTGPDSMMLVAIASTAAAESIVGCCQLENRDDAGYFGAFAVRPTGQGAGIGGALLARAEQEVVDRWTVAAMEMTVIAQRTDLIDWYLRRGYAPTGERRPFPYGNEEFGLPRRDDLEFVVLAKRLAALGRSS
jgi:ribosomal protein S18 acetylase RimI-like enzyme